MTKWCCGYLQNRILVDILHKYYLVQSHDAGIIQDGNLHCGGTGTMTVMNAEGELGLSNCDRTKP